jgi:hypothetical protein
MQQNAGAPGELTGSAMAKFEAKDCQLKLTSSCALGAGQ